MIAVRATIFRCLSGANLAALLLSATCLAADDPAIVFSSFLGGSSNDFALAMSGDREGNVYVAGRTFSSDFPILNAWQSNIAAGGSAFLTKIDSSGRLLFSTFFGAGLIQPEAVTLDTDGNIYVVGLTRSVELPTTAGAFQGDYGGGSAFGRGDAFIAKFSNDGSRLLFCSYLGGGGDDTATSVAIDAQGNVVVAGATDSTMFPGTTTQRTPGQYDIFIAKLNPTGERLLWSKTIGGRNGEWAPKLRLGPDDAVYFTGWTVSPDLPVTANARQRLHQLCTSELADACEDLLPSPIHQWWDGFFGILEPDGSALRYLSYYGHEFIGTNYIEFNVIFDLAISPSGAVFLGGEIDPEGGNGRTSNVFQRTPGGGVSDAFVARLNPPDWRVEWFSYLGGSDEEWINAVVLDSQENVHVTGRTLSRNFPLVDPLSKRADGSPDGFLAKIGPDGRTLAHSTLIGGSDVENAFALALGSDQLPVVAGVTKSTNFPVRNAFQPRFAGSAGREEAFVMKLHPGPVRPLLEMVRSANNVVLSWPAEAGGFVLESASGIPAQEWKPVADTPLVFGDRKTVIVRATGENQFFRLKRP